MPNVPVRREQLRHKLTAFTAWLNENGAEICTPTNVYEVIRYRAYSGASRRAMTHIIYAKENGLLTWTGGSLGHFKSFLYGWAMGAAKEPKPDHAAPVPIADQPESLSRHRKRKLKDRDGSDCWFCGVALVDDITVEHLVPKSRGGGNNLANLVLAHRQCNADAANLSISEKVDMRTRLRSGVPA